MAINWNKNLRGEYFSDCCGAEMKGVQIDFEICPDCKEHCEVVDAEAERDWALDNAIDEAREEKNDN